MFELQSIGSKLDYIVLPFLFIVPALLAYAVFLLARLPGRIAHGRDHRYASAVNVCGWLGLITGISWPIALVWAYVDPHAERVPQAGVSPGQSAVLAAKLQSMNESLEAIENKLSQPQNVRSKK